MSGVFLEIELLVCLVKNYECYSLTEDLNYHEKCHVNKDWISSKLATKLFGVQLNGYGLLHDKIDHNDKFLDK